MSRTLVILSKEDIQKLSNGKAVVLNSNSELSMMVILQKETYDDYRNGKITIEGLT